MHSVIALHLQFPAQLRTERNHFADVSKMVGNLIPASFASFFRLFKDLLEISPLSIFHDFFQISYKLFNVLYWSKFR